MTENTTRFSLAYSSLIFYPSIIKSIREMSQSNKTSQLICNNILINTENSEINSFLLLFYQPNPSLISEHISLER